MQDVFPRDRELCTRCPVKLSLRPCADAKQESIILRFKSTERKVEPESVLAAVGEMMEAAVRDVNGGQLSGIVHDELVSTSSRLRQE